VLWFVTVEPSLPWGGSLSTPEYLVITDATGEEVINTSLADQVMRLYEFTDEDGDRTWRTPMRYLSMIHGKVFIMRATTSSTEAPTSFSTWSTSRRLSPGRV
jgi:hypothetical protein